MGRLRDDDDGDPAGFAGAVTFAGGEAVDVADAGDLAGKPLEILAGDRAAAVLQAERASQLG